MVDADHRASGEFDGINLKERVFIEDKSAKGLDKVNPKTGLRHHTPQAWARDKIFDKTDTRIKNLAKATATKPGKGGTPTVPGIEQIRGIRRLHFRIDANSKEVRDAVEAEVKNLRHKYPDWDFTTQYGR